MATGLDDVDIPHGARAIDAEPDHDTSPTIDVFGLMARKNLANLQRITRELSGTGTCGRGGRYRGS